MIKQCAEMLGDFTLVFAGIGARLINDAAGRAV